MCFIATPSAAQVHNRLCADVGALELTYFPSLLPNEPRRAPSSPECTGDLFSKLHRFLFHRAVNVQNWTQAKGFAEQWRKREVVSMAEASKRNIIKKTFLCVPIIETPIRLLKEGGCFIEKN